MTSRSERAERAQLDAEQRDAWRAGWARALTDAGVSPVAAMGSACAFESREFKTPGAVLPMSSRLDPVATMARVLGVKPNWNSGWRRMGCAFPRRRCCFERPEGCHVVVMGGAAPG